MFELLAHKTTSVCRPYLLTCVGLFCVYVAIDFMLETDSLRQEVAFCQVTLLVHLAYLILSTLKIVEKVIKVEN